MSAWDFLWRPRPEGLLLDANGDGMVDGVAACLVPLTPALFTPDVWAAAANLAARLGLETPAIHLPLVTEPDAVALWQVPLLISVGDDPAILGTTTGAVPGPALWRPRFSAYGESGRRGRALPAHARSSPLETSCGPL